MTPARGQRAAPEKDAETLRIAITGSNGLVGKALVPFLTARGHDVVRLVRSIVLAIREQPYIEAATAIGTSMPLILIRHLLPNALPPLIAGWGSAKKRRKP